MAYANNLKASRTAKSRSYSSNLLAEQFNSMLPYMGHKRSHELRVRNSKLARIDRLTAYMCRASA